MNVSCTSEQALKILAIIVSNTGEGVCLYAIDAEEMVTRVFVSTYESIFRETTFLSPQGLSKGDLLVVCPSALLVEDVTA
jgi:hypothetical protein